MSQYREKFLEAEEKASGLVKQLDELKKSLLKQKSISENLDNAFKELSSLTQNLSIVLVENQNLIQQLNEIDIDRIFNEMLSIKQELSEIKQEQLENGKRNLLKITKLSTLMLIILGLTLIIGLINIFI